MHIITIFEDSDSIKIKESIVYQKLTVSSLVRI